MKEQLELYVKRVKERHEQCRDNEAHTKQALIAPLFSLLGWDMADPSACVPEYRADFGRGERAATPVDWAFAAVPPAFSFIVEAKECGKKLKAYAEQLGMYFAKASVNLGIYTNGVHWQFYTDLDKAHIMDKEPFLSWDILGDDTIPLDFLTLMQKSAFQPQLIKTFAERGRRQSLLVNELKKLLEPSADFIKLAIKEIETRALHPSVVEEWRPILVNAIQEWAKVKSLEMVLERPAEKQANHTRTTQANDESTDKGGASTMRKRFWEALLSRPKVKTTRHANIAPGEYTYIGAGSGVRGLPFNYVTGQDEGRVELYIDRGADEEEGNKDLFDGLHKQKAEIEKTFGGELSWQRLEGKRACRVAYGTTGGWKNDESEWPEIQDAMIDAMMRLEKAFAPHLVRLKTELASEGA